MPLPFSNGARPQRRVCRTALARAVHSAVQQGCSARGDGAAAVTPPHSSDGWHGRAGTAMRGPAGLWPARRLEIAPHGRKRRQRT